MQTRYSWQNKQTWRDCVTVDPRACPGLPFQQQTKHYVITCYIIIIIIIYWIRNYPISVSVLILLLVYCIDTVTGQTVPRPWNARSPEVIGVASCIWGIGARAPWILRMYIVHQFGNFYLDIFPLGSRRTRHIFTSQPQIHSRLPL